MSIYAPPTTLTVHEAIHEVFIHYCSSGKPNNAENTNVSIEEDIAMDAFNFARLIRDSPGLAKNIGRTEVDVIFSAVKPPKTRKLSYSHFLEALLELAMKIFPDVDPITALANFMARFIFALFDQPPAATSQNVIEKIMTELQLAPQTQSLPQ